MATKTNGNIINAMLRMFVISIPLFWLPVIGALSAGIVGGKKAGSPGRAMIAVILPAILLGGGLLAFSSNLSGLPIVRVVSGLRGLSFAMFNIGPLMIGAIIGGVLSK